MATENLKTGSLGNMWYQELGLPVFEVDATNNQQSVFSGALSFKFEMEKVSNEKYKQLKLSTPNYQVQQV
ncbi:hypothetical protein MKX01_033918, partial [Papaver californicum]